MAENQMQREGSSKEKEEENTPEQFKVVGEEEVRVENHFCNIQNPFSCSSNLSLDFSSVFNDQNSQLEETLVDSSLILSSDHEDYEIPSFSQLLNSVVISTSLDSMEILSVGGKLTVPTITTVPDSLDKIQYSMSHQDVVENVAAHDECPISSVDLTPDSVSQSILSVSRPVPSQQSLGDCPISFVDLIPSSVIQAMPSVSPQKSSQLVPEVNSLCKPEMGEQKTLGPDMKATQVVFKAPTPDGYNWRKYGQKQVKSSESNRSYYRCTYVSCHAKKKVERCDLSSRLVEIIYKGRHNHDPPRKVRSFKGRKLISSAESGGATATLDRSVQKPVKSDSFKLKKETRNVMPKQQLHNLNENVKFKAEEALGHETIKKQRKRERNVAFSITPIKTVKEPKVVVQAAGDLGISIDGYRWRKYGQKMVKGSPNPRSYYKCTSAECPVRKHVERASEDASTIIITYEGKHDHDMPVPKKRHGPPSITLAAAAATNNSTQTEFSKSDGTANQKTWSVDMVEGGKGILTRTSEIGGEMVLESARTLLSIGIELKPY
ncbi:probable WRKY transcription factor 32 isoform X2 [Papaver somniferum]|uniref:probable WRKY transcription factor 32 isoform X2 n=1 Tax=Papaver somniferum TaxID=3469 RepID=UPI000E6F97A5|nr:probable WRKY transcription factor 32 isoform X2 [Papaver somniferum]